MLIDQEAGFTPTAESVYQIPAVKHQLSSRNPVREQGQPVEDLRATVENLQKIVCELLLENQILRTASSGTERSFQIPRRQES
jgi:hypothetical protein